MHLVGTAHLPLCAAWPWGGAEQHHRDSSGGGGPEGPAMAEPRWHAGLPASSSGTESLHQGDGLPCGTVRLVAQPLLHLLPRVRDRNTQPMPPAQPHLAKKSRKTNLNPFPQKNQAPRNRLKPTAGHSAPELWAQRLAQPCPQLSWSPPGDSSTRPCHPLHGVLGLLYPKWTKQTAPSWHLQHRTGTRRCPQAGPSVLMLGLVLFLVRGLLWSVVRCNIFLLFRWFFF